MAFSNENFWICGRKVLIKHKELLLNVTIIINAISNNDMDNFPTEAKGRDTRKNLILDVELESAF